MSELLHVFTINIFWILSRNKIKKILFTFSQVYWKVDTSVLFTFDPRPTSEKTVQNIYYLLTEIILKVKHLSIFYAAVQIKGDIVHYIYKYLYLTDQNYFSYSMINH